MTGRETRFVAGALVLLGIIALLAAEACFSLARPTPPLEEYVLGGSARAVAAARAPDAAGVTIGLRRLDLAPYLATRAIVVRRGAQIVSSEFRRWGEEPGAGISRAVAAFLGAAPRILAVDVAPWAVQAQHDYLVQLHVFRLEGVAPEDSTATMGDVHVMAAWEIIRPQEGTIVARGESDRRETGWRVGDYRGLVTRVDTGLSELASDLAACLDRLASTPPPVAAAGGRPLVCAAH